MRASRRTKFEIGLVYSDNTRVYLSVSESTLGTVKNGEWLLHTPKDLSCFVVEDFSTNHLCRIWDITEEKLTEMFWGGNLHLPESYFKKPKGLCKTKRLENAKQDPGPRVHKYFGYKTDLIGE